MASESAARTAMQAVVLPTHLLTEQILSRSFSWLCLPASPSVDEDCKTQMGSPRQFPEPGKKGRGQSSVKQSLCDAVLQLVIQRTRAVGHGDHVCEELKSHFATLPARYALNVDPMRHEDVLMHMRLLLEARDIEDHARNYPEEPYPSPNLHVRKVLLQGREPDEDGEDRGRGIPIPRVPKPAFGSNLNLVGLGSGGSPASLAKYGRSGSPSLATPPNRNTPPSFLRRECQSPSYRNTPSSRSIPRHRSSSYNSLSEMEEDSSGDSSGPSGMDQGGGVMDQSTLGKSLWQQQIGTGF